MPALLTLCHRSTPSALKSACPPILGLHMKVAGRGADNGSSKESPAYWLPWPIRPGQTLPHSTMDNGKNRQHGSMKENLRYRKKRNNSLKAWQGVGSLKNSFLSKCKVVLENIYLMFKNKVFKRISFLLNKNWLR